MKEIPTIKGVYINEDGTVVYSDKLKRNLSIVKMVKHYTNKDYIQNLVNINQKSYCISRLVYETYKGMIPKGMCIDHIDNNPQNNHWSNLQALTYSENLKKQFVDDPMLRNKRSVIRKMCAEKTYIKKSNSVKNPHKCFICVETNKQFKTLKEAADYFGISVNKVFRNLKFNDSTGIGKSFKYVE